MPYTVSNRPNAETGKTEYIVVNRSGVMALPPHGGPFSSKAEADASCAALLKMLSIEEWIALTNSKREDQIEGMGKVLHIAPNGQWIRNKGYSVAVYPSTEADVELEIGEMVSVDKSGEIKLLDREPRSLGMRL